MSRPVERIILIFIWSLILNLGYAQIDSLPRKKWFLKANAVLSVPFDGKNFNLAFNSIAVLRLTKRLNMHEYGFSSITYQNQHKDLNDYTYRYFNIRLSYQYNFVILKKTKIKPYVGINNDILLYHEFTITNSFYNRKVWNYGFQDRTQIFIGAFYLHKNRVLFDLSISPFLGFLFEPGYKVQYNGNPILSKDMQKIGGYYFDYNRVTINQFSNIFKNGIYLKFGIGFKL